MMMMIRYPYLIQWIISFQDPVLFSGMLKFNVDPLNVFSDDEIWRALECAHLKSFTMKQPEGLLYDCGEAGQNFRYNTSIAFFVVFFVFFFLWINLTSLDCKSFINCNSFLV
jgi:hypothetical protein